MLAFTRARKFFFFFLFKGAKKEEGELLSNHKFENLYFSEEINAVTAHGQAQCIILQFASTCSNISRPILLLNGRTMRPQTSVYELLLFILFHVSFIDD